MQIIVTMISTYLIKKFDFIPFLFFLRSQKHESNFQQADGLLTRKFLDFFTASHAVHQRHGEFSRNLKRNFLA